MVVKKFPLVGWETVVGRCTQFALMLLSIKAITSLISPYQYGVYGLAMAVIAIFAYIFIGPVGLSINRYINEWAVNGFLQKILHKYFYYLIIVSVFAGAFVGTQSENFFLGFIAGFLYLLSQAIATTLIPNLNILGHTKQFYLLLNINLFLSIVFGCILIKFFTAEYEYWLLGISLGNVLASAWAYKFYFRKIFLLEIFTEQVNYRKYFSFSSFIFISSIFTWLYLMGYRFIAEDQLGYGGLGVYLACAAIPSGIISAYEQVTTGVFLPKLYRNIELSKDAWLMYAKKIAATSVPVCFFIIFNSEILAKYLLSEEYRGAYKFIQYCAVAEVIRVLISTFGYKFHGDASTHLMIAPSIFLAIAANALTFSYIDNYGAFIIPLAMIISGSFVLIIYAFIIGVSSLSVFIRLLIFIAINLLAIFSITQFIGYIELTSHYKDILHFILISITTGALFLFALLND